MEEPLSKRYFSKDRCKREPVFALHSFFQKQITPQRSHQTGFEAETWRTESAWVEGSSAISRLFKNVEKGFDFFDPLRHFMVCVDKNL